MKYEIDRKLCRKVFCDFGFPAFKIKFPKFQLLYIQIRSGLIGKHTDHNEFLYCLQKGIIVNTVANERLENSSTKAKENSSICNLFILKVKLYKIMPLRRDGGMACGGCILL